MQGFSAAFNTGERPVWESPIYRDLVLGNAFNAGNEKAPSKPGVKQLADSLGLLTAQLYVMSNSNTLAPALITSADAVEDNLKSFVSGAKADQSVPSPASETTRLQNQTRNLPWDSAH